MARTSPPRPTPRTVALLGALSLAFLVYAVLAMGNPLVGLFSAAVLVAAYATWRFLLAVEAMGDGLQRIADVREAESGDER